MFFLTFWSDEKMVLQFDYASNSPIILLGFFKVWKKDRHRSVDLETNRLRAVILPVFAPPLFSELPFILSSRSFLGWLWSLNVTHESEKYTRGYPECIIYQVQLHLMCKMVKASSKSTWFPETALNKHVIHVNFHITTNSIFEHFVHQLLVSWPCILQGKQHYPITK